MIRPFCIFSIAGFAMASLISSFASGQVTGAIAGTVSDDQGASVGSAKVVYHNIVGFSRDSSGHLIQTGQRISQSVMTNATGAFTIGAMPPGDYYVCVYPSNPKYVSNCDWNPTVQPVHIGAAAAAPAPAPITLRIGTILTIAVNDPLGRLVPGAKFYPGVATDQGYFAAARRQASTAAQAVVYTVTIPKMQNVRLFIDTDFQIFDSVGNAIPAGVKATTIPGNSQDAVTVAVTVK